MRLAKGLSKISSYLSFKIFHIINLRVKEGGGFANIANTSSPANPVNVLVDGIRQIVVDDVFNTGDVKTLKEKPYQVSEYERLNFNFINAEKKSQALKHAKKRYMYLWLQRWWQPRCCTCYS